MPHSYFGQLGIHFFLCCSMMFSSCGKGFVTEEIQQEEIASGNYYSILKPLNSKLGRYSGWATITIADNQFWVRIKLNGPRTSMMHAQYLQANSICPSMSDDTNGDGYLDFQEAHSVSGRLLIPFDSDLKTQLKGLDLFPRVRRNSSYYYSEACNTAFMMEDLRSSDNYSSDMLGKLGFGEGLDLHKRVILIYGTDENHDLPTTVRSYDGYPNQASIPIACGVVLEGELDGFN